MLRLQKLTSNLPFMQGEIPIEESVTFMHQLGLFLVGLDVQYRAFTAT